MVIDVEGLVKRYEEHVAVDHLNLEVEEGEIFGLLGPDGAGKSTTINCILSLIKYDKGFIKLFGRYMSETAYDLKARIGVAMQDIAIFREITVYDNIDFFCGLYERKKKKRKELVEQALEFTGLTEFRKLYPTQLTTGLLQKLNIACGIAHHPELLILDEPLTGVDSENRVDILKIIKKLNKQGVTIFFVSHNVEDVEKICRKIALIDEGKIIAEGTKEELKAMINIRENITIEILETSPTDLVSQMEELPNVHSAELEGNILHVKSRKGKHNLSSLLYYFQEHKIAIGNVYSEEPTLGDVFLEMTGKELMNNG